MDKLILTFKSSSEFILICFLFFSFSSVSAEDTLCVINNGEIDIASAWRFQTGDNLKWANAGFDDSNWDEILGNRFWEEQGYENYDGYAWYRIKVFIPSAIKNQAFYKNRLQFIIGNIDDTDQTFLNGKLIGQNGKTIQPGSHGSDDFTGNRVAYKIFRNYVLPVDDSRILWDQINTIAIRVHDFHSGGGLFGPNSFIGMIDLKEFFKIHYSESSFQLINENEFWKILEIENISKEDTLSYHSTQKKVISSLSLTTL